MVNWQVSFQTCWLPERRCLLITRVLPFVSIIREVDVMAIQNCMYCTSQMCTCPSYFVNRILYIIKCIFLKTLNCIYLIILLLISNNDAWYTTAYYCSKNYWWIRLMHTNWVSSEKHRCMAPTTAYSHWLSYHTHSSTSSQRQQGEGCAKLRCLPMLVVFFISSIVHEYILAFAFRFFYPVLLVMFGGFGGELHNLITVTWISYACIFAAPNFREGNVRE